MKKIFNIVIVLFFLFYAYQFVFTYFSKGHTITYDIVDGNYTVNVKEIFRNDTDVDKPNYSISINAYGDVFFYLVYAIHMQILSETQHDLKKRNH